LNSLRRIGIDTSRHDIRFVEDDWESPTLGASGLGWEVWCDGMEVTQFTYIQKMGGLECEVVSCEITYGLERLIMYVQDKDNVYDLDYNQYQDKNLRISYGDVFQRTEAELSEYAMNLANTDMLLQHFKDLEAESLSLIARRLAVPAYELCMKCSHIFNLLDARGVIGTTERARYIARVRNLARGACNIWLGHEPQLEDLSFEEDEDNEN
jgi:glycyl-tRNA synthetase alpha chain